MPTREIDETNQDLLDEEDETGGWGPVRIRQSNVPEAPSATPSEERPKPDYEALRAQSLQWSSKNLQT